MSGSESQPSQPNSSQSVGDITSSGSNNNVALNQAGGDANIDQSETQAAVENSDLQAALDAIQQLKQSLSKSDGLNPVEKKQAEFTIGMLEEELQKPKPDKGLIDQTVIALKKGLEGAIALAEPVTKVAELVATAWMAI